MFQVINSIFSNPKLTIKHHSRLGSIKIVSHVLQEEPDHCFLFTQPNVTCFLEVSKNIQNQINMHFNSLNPFENNPIHESCAEKKSKLDQTEIKNKRCQILYRR